MMSRTKFLAFSMALVLVANVCFPAGAAIAQAVNASLTPEQRAKLEKDLKQVEEEIKVQEAILKEQQNKSSSIERDIAILTAKINKAKLTVKAKNIEIEKLSKDIGKKNTLIGELDGKMGRQKESLAQIMRRTNELDQYSISEILLSNTDVSEFFIDADSFDSVRVALRESFEELRDVKDETTVEKKSLQTRKDQETDARIAIEAEKREIEKNEAEKKRLLSFSKQQEQAYSVILADRAKKAAEIRSALFDLRDTGAIPFGKALEYATEASRKTGIRPAFLLAILTQESSLGKNVGSCYLTNKDTGAGLSVKSGNIFPNVMKPARDVGPFFDITQSLGLDPFKTLVSCPQSVGWGGAMGPAQFIPSTWMLFKDRIGKALGKPTPNPWTPLDAFMASAMYLTDLGAYAGSYTGERNAACRYYSGRACVNGTINATYGSQVMSKAQNIQENMIDLLLNN
jgi:membrane-bound lytic murein transglycosylase B